MLLYATLLIIALALAAGIVWFYRSTTDTSKAIYTTILPDTLETPPTDHPENVAGQKPATKAPQPWDRKQHATPGNVARTHAAQSAEKTPWGWPGNEHQVREQGAGSSGHCSLYEDPGTDDPPNIREQNVGWPYREEVAESEGRAYKVSRKKKTANRKTNLEHASKPWGW